ncbi:hypothetical protein EON63_16615 [archaeon]|nr:MAG: hypothetical protein EON63_16615 [archaeon]
MLCMCCVCVCVYVYCVCISYLILSPLCRYHKASGISFSSLYPGCMAESPLFREKVGLICSQHTHKHT